jgi:hypothetical protein
MTKSMGDILRDSLVKKQIQENKDKEYVVLEGLKQGNRFYSMNDGTDPRFSAEGELWYKILGFVDTSDEAITIIEGGDPLYSTKKFLEYLENMNELFDQMEDSQ